MWGRNKLAKYWKNRLRKRKNTHKQSQKINFSTHSSHKHPLQLHYTPPVQQYTHPQIHYIRHWGCKYYISYLTSWLSVPSRHVSLPDCILILWATTNWGAGSSKKNTNHNCSKSTLCLGQWGMTEKNVVVKRLRNEKVRRRRKTKWERREMMRGGERWEFRAEGPKEWWWGSGDSASRKSLSLFICFPPFLYISNSLSLPLCGMILFRLPLFLFSPSLPLCLYVWGCDFFFFCAFCSQKYDTARMQKQQFIFRKANTNRVIIIILTWGIPSCSGWPNHRWALPANGV